MSKFGSLNIIILFISIYLLVLFMLIKFPVFMQMIQVWPAVVKMCVFFKSVLMIELCVTHCSSLWEKQLEALLLSHLSVRDSVGL